jgi:hypothetical protein
LLYLSEFWFPHFTNKANISQHGWKGQRDFQDTEPTMGQNHPLLDFACSQVALYATFIMSGCPLMGQSFLGLGGAFAFNNSSQRIREDPAQTGIWHFSSSLRE